MGKEITNNGTSNAPKFGLHSVSKRKFYLIQFGLYGSGHDSDINMHKCIFWGTWIEAAREIIKNDQSITKGEKRYYRKITEFSLPDVSHKRRPFYAL